MMVDEWPGALSRSFFLEFFFSLPLSFSHSWGSLSGFSLSLSHTHTQVLSGHLCVVPGLVRGEGRARGRDRPPDEPSS